METGIFLSFYNSKLTGSLQTDTTGSQKQYSEEEPHK